MSKKVVIVVGLVVAVFGVACLNYTNAWNYEHHTEWSSESGLPGPTPPIFFAGAALTLVGGIVLGRAATRPGS